MTPLFLGGIGIKPGGADRPGGGPVTAKNMWFDIVLMLAPPPWIAACDARDFKASKEPG
jgi:hypothetical protein